MSTRKILVVDDSKSARFALRMLLQKHGYLVDTAESGEEGLEKMRADPPHAVFMDHLMPGMNGFQTLDAIKADPAIAHIPVIMCTSNDDEPYVRQAKAKGALDIMPKPASPEKLQAVLRAVEESATAHAAAAPPAAAAVPGAPPFDPDALVDKLRQEIRAWFDTEFKPSLVGYFNQRLDESRQSLRGEISQARQDTRDELTRELRRQIAEIPPPEAVPAPPAVEDGALLARLDGRFQQLENAMLRKHMDQAQALANRLSQELIPDAMDRHLGQLEQRLDARADQQVEQRFEDLKERLLREIPANNSLIRRLGEMAETAAEQKASEVASAKAHEVALIAASERAGEVADSLTAAAHQALGRINLLVAAAAGVGVLAALLVYFLK